MTEPILLGDNIDKDQWQEIFAAIDPGLLEQQLLVVWDWRFITGKYVYQAFPWSQWYDICSKHQDSKIVLVIDSMYEAPHYQTHLKPLVDALLVQGRLGLQDIINLTGGEESAPDIVTINCLGAFRKFSRRLVPADEIKHCFIMLARIPKMLRVLAAVKMIEWQLDGMGYASCGVREAEDLDMLWLENWVPEYLRHRFPMVLDGTVKDFNEQQFSTDDERIRCAAINVICETSQDAHLYAGAAPCTVWSDRFITEKTSKAFGLLQLPLWVAVPGTVQSVRDHGFDVFDDIIDHGYDNEADPHKRVNLVMTQLHKLSHLNLEQLSELRRNISHRLEHNKSLSDSLICNLTGTVASMLSKILQDR